MTKPYTNEQGPTSNISLDWTADQKRSNNPTVYPQAFTAWQKPLPAAFTTVTPRYTSPAKKKASANAWRKSGN